VIKSSAQTTGRSRGGKSAQLQNHDKTMDNNNQVGTRKQIKNCLYFSTNKKPPTNMTVSKIENSGQNLP
jgi:hypothetical protein